MVKCAFHQFIRTTLKWNSVFPRICGKLYSTVLYCRNYIFHIFCGIQFFKKVAPKIGIELIYYYMTKFHWKDSTNFVEFHFP